MYIDRDSAGVLSELDLPPLDLQFLVFGVVREDRVQRLSKRRRKPSLTAPVREFTESFVRM